VSNTNKLKVLYIDDEVNNLNSFKASFRFELNILTALSADEALSILNQNEDIVAILSDQRMPGKTGVEFFEEIRYKFPKPVRILITGFTDIEDVVSAINKGHIFRYIRKPWSDSDVLSSIQEAEKYYIATSLLMQQNNELRTAYQALDRFAYSVTHDLKGPIVSGLAMLDLMRHEKNEADRIEMTDLLSASLTRLNNFVDHIFDYYKLKQGELNIEEINFQSLIDQQKDIHGTAIKTKNIKLNTSLNQQMPFLSDALKLQIIIYNLLSNAIKYQRIDNPDKYVNLDIIIANGNAIIKVSDNGIGIEKEFMPKIFDVFYRATALEAGAGIGLYNLKDAVTKLNGQVNVTSDINAGTEFTVTIPSK
jgi:two-component system sensor histidine kinase/response regulator